MADADSDSLAKRATKGVPISLSKTKKAKSLASTYPVLEFEYPPVRITAIALATGLAPVTFTPWA